MITHAASPKTFLYCFIEPPLQRVCFSFLKNDASYVLHSSGMSKSSPDIPVEFCSYGAHCFCYPDFRQESFFSFRNPILTKDEFLLSGQ